MIEYNYILNGPHRTYFDLLTLRAAGSPLYVPLWYEPVPLKLDATIGDTVVWCDTIYTELFAAKYCFIRGPQPWDYEVKEIFGISFYGVSFETGLEKEWKKGTFVYPMRLCRVESQARSTHRTHLVMQATVRFESIDLATPPILPDLVPLYLEHYVLETNPNEAEDLQYDYGRINVVLDNQMGIPALYDVAGYTQQQFHWWAKGRENQHTLRNLFHVLAGRRVPIWVPTFYRDLEPIYWENDVLHIVYCGFTDLGGSFTARMNIVIELRNGTRIYRQIIQSAVEGANEGEALRLDAALDNSFTVDDIRRISFLAFSRLDQDTVEFTHHTDTGGLTTATTTFRMISDIFTAVRHKGGPFYNLDPDLTTAFSEYTLTTLPDTANTLLVAGWVGYANTVVGHNWTVWFLQNTPGTLMAFSVGDGTTIPLGHFGLLITLFDSESTHILDGYVDIPVDLTSGWHSYAVSVDTTTQTIQIVVDRKLYPVGPYLLWDSSAPIGAFNTPNEQFEYGGTQSGLDTEDTPPALDYQGPHNITLKPFSPDVFIGAFRFGMGEPFFDLTVDANLDRLFLPGNHSAKWGEHGELVTGIVPQVYLTGDASEYQQNQGEEGTPAWEYYGFKNYPVEALP
jgi:hypothetical protein